MAGHPGILKDFDELLPHGMTLDSCLKTLFPGSDMCETCEPSTLESGALTSSSTQMSPAAVTDVINCSFCGVKDRTEVPKVSSLFTKYFCIFFSFTKLHGFVFFTVIVIAPFIGFLAYSLCIVPSKN